MNVFPVGGSCLAAFGAVALVTSCSTPPPTEATTSPTATGYGVVQEEGLTVAGPAIGGSASAVVSGTVRLDQRKCWMVAVPSNGEGVVVWPAGTRWSDSSHNTIRLPSGDEVHQGDKITAGGAYNQDVDRSNVSISPDVTCLQGAKLTFATVDDVKVSSP